MVNIERELEFCYGEVDKIDEAIDYYMRMLRNARGRREEDEINYKLDTLESKKRDFLKDIDDMEYELKRNSYNKGYRNERRTSTYSSLGRSSDSYDNYNRNRENIGGVSKTTTYRPKTNIEDVSKVENNGNRGYTPRVTGKSEQQPQQIITKEITHMPALTQTQKEYYAGRKRTKPFIIDTRLTENGTVNNVCSLIGNDVRYSLAVDSDAMEFIHKESSKNLTYDVFSGGSKSKFVRDEDTLLSQYVQDDISMASSHMVREILETGECRDIYINRVWPGKIKSICVPLNFEIRTLKDDGRVEYKKAYDYYKEINGVDEDIEGFKEAVKNSIIAFNNFIYTTKASKASDLSETIDKYDPIYRMEKGLGYLPTQYVDLIRNILKEMYNNLLKFTLDIGKDIIGSFSSESVKGVESAFSFDNEKYFNDNIKKTYGTVIEAFLNEVNFMFIGCKYMNVVEIDNLLSITTYMFHRQPTFLLNINGEGQNSDIIETICGGEKEGFVVRDSSPVLWHYIQSAFSYLSFSSDEGESIKRNTATIIITDKHGVKVKVFQVHRVADQDIDNPSRSERDKGDMYYLTPFTL